MPKMALEAVACPGDGCGRFWQREVGQWVTCGRCATGISPLTRGEPAGSVMVWTAGEVRTVCERYPEVEWDRVVRVDGRWTVFGWVPREARPGSERSHDFVVLTFDREGISTNTSSPKHSLSFYERIGGDAEGHVDCERVADVLGL